MKRNWVGVLCSIGLVSAYLFGSNTEQIMKRYDQGITLSTSERAAIADKLEARENLETLSRQRMNPRNYHPVLNSRDTFLEDFEGAWPPAGWTVVDVDGGSYINPTFTYFAPYSGSQGVQAMGCQNDYLITPPVLVQLPTDSLSFYLRTESTSYTNSFEILVSTTGNDPADFTHVIASFNEYTNTTWTRMSFSLNDFIRDRIYIAFHVTYSQSTFWDFGFDDITIPQTYWGPNPPAAAYSPVPADSSDMISVFQNLVWANGMGTEGCYLNFGTDNPPTNIAGSLDLGDTSVYTPDTLLAYDWTYYWQIVPYNEYGDNTDTPVWSFSTESTLSLPTTEDFEAGYPPVNWTEDQGLIANPTVLDQYGYSSWTQDGFGNDGFTGSAKVNIYGTSRNEWMFTPAFNLGDGNVDYRLEFDLALTPWLQTTATQLGDDDLFAVVISTDYGQTWSEDNILRSWTYQDDISNTGDHIIVPLTGYTGYVKLGFYGESTVSNADNDLFVDNVQIRVTPTTPIFTSDPEEIYFDSTTIGESSEFLPVEITNTGIDTLIISSVELVGPDSGQFTLSDVNTYPVELTIYDMLDFAVQFHPDTLGVLNATLQVTDDQGRTVHEIPIVASGQPDILNPPGYLVANAGIASAHLLWGPPGTQMGDLFINAIPIPELPFTDTGNTSDYNNDYGPFTQDGLYCPWENYYSSTSEGMANDVVYVFTLQDETTVTASLCGSGYDTAIALYNTDDESQVLGNDDFCGLQSEVSCSLPAGTYYIVVDGYSTSTGDYTLSVTTGGARSEPDPDLVDLEAEKEIRELSMERPEPGTAETQSTPRSFLGYNLYRAYQANPYELILENTSAVSYTDTNLVPGDQYNYKVAAVYTTGESEFAGPVTIIPDAIPGPAVIIQFPVAGDTVFQNPVELDFNVAYFTVAPFGAGDGILRYVVDGGDTNTETSTSTLWLSDLGLGEHHVYMELVDNDTLPLDPPANDDVTFIRGNHAPEPFTLYYAYTNNGNINILPSNLSSSSIFYWNESNDPDGTELDYYLYFLTDSDSLMMRRLSGTSISLTNQAIYDSLSSHNWPTVVSCVWDVMASDGEVQTWAADPLSVGPINIDWSSMSVDDQAALPKKFALYANYPNPFNPVTTVAYDIPEASDVLLEIYNITGQRVKILVNKRQEPNRYKVQWNGTNEAGAQLSSGMYFYRIQAKDYSSVKKLILMK